MYVDASFEIYLLKLFAYIYIDFTFNITFDKENMEIGNLLKSLVPPFPVNFRYKKILCAAFSDLE